MEMNERDRERKKERERDSVAKKLTINLFHGPKMIRHFQTHMMQNYAKKNTFIINTFDRNNPTALQVSF